MSFYPLAFVVGMNLLADELADEEKVKLMENAFVAEIGRFFPGGLLAENVIFHFSVDPSVTTPKVPVLFRVTLLPGMRCASRRDEAIERLAQQLKVLLPDRIGFIVFELLDEARMGTAKFE